LKNEKNTPIRVRSPKEERGTFVLERLELISIFSPILERRWEIIPFLRWEAFWDQFHWISWDGFA